MRIAVLFYGQFRSGWECLASQPFLQDPNIDLFFSLWDDSFREFPLLNMRVDYDIPSHQDLEELTKRTVTSVIESMDDFAKSQGAVGRMLHRFKRGIELIDPSKYDYCLVVRPDLTYYKLPIFSDLVKTMNENTLYVPFGDIDAKVLGDVWVFGDCEKVLKLLERLDYFEWQWGTDYNNDWHRYMYDMSAQFFSDIKISQSIVPVDLLRFNSDIDKEYFTFIEELRIIEGLISHGNRVAPWCPANQIESSMNLLGAYFNGDLDNQIKTLQSLIRKSNNKFTVVTLHEDRNIS